MDVRPEKAFIDVPRGAAIIGIAIVMVIYAKMTGDVRPFAVYTIGVSLAFLLFAINYLFGKLKS